MQTISVIARGLMLGPLALVWVVVVVRLVGLRSFSKMATFDFVVTIATGSMLAGAATSSNWPDFFQALIGIFALLGFQYIIARIRIHSPGFKDLIENEPTILMSHGVFYRDLMRKVRVTEGDIWAKLREANALDISDVRAVILETTGDISVLHGAKISKGLFTGVSGMERIT